MSGTFNIPKRDTHTRSNPGTIIEKRGLLAKDNQDGLSLKADIEHALALNNQKISERIQTQKNSKRTINNFQLPTLHGFDKTMESPVSQQILAPHEEERHLRFLVKTMSSSSSKSPKSGGYMSKGSMPVSIRNSTKGQLPLAKKTSAVVESSPKLSSREQFDTVPDKLFESERRLIANMKLEQDRILTQSRSGTKRNVSYAHDSLHRLPSSQSYDRGELFGLHNSVGPMTGPLNGPMSPMMSKTSIDKLKGHIGEVGNTMGQMRTFAFNLQHANSQSQSPETPEYGRSATLYMNTGTGNNNEDRKVHSNIFNEHFLQSFNKQKTLDKDFVAGYSFERGFKVKKAFEVGTKKGAEIPRLWTSNSPIKPTTPTPNTASPQRVGTSSGNRMLTMPFTVRDGTGPTLLRKDTVTKEVKEDSPLIAELKKEVPNMFSGAPASRQDVVTMATWVDEKVNSINKAGDNESEKYKKCEEVYNICLNELLRQVSLDCLERGELMYKLWMSYYKIFAQFKVNLEAEHEKMKEEVKRDSQKLYDYYDELSRTKENEVEKLKAEIEELVKEKEETNKKMTKIVEKDTRHRDKIAKLVNILTQMTAQVQDLTNENDLFKKRYGKKTDFGTKVGKKNQVLIEAGSPKNSEQPRPLFIPLDEDGKARKSKEPAKEPVGFGDNEEVDSDESKESSIDFIYEDIDHNQHVHKMKLLNADNSADGTPGRRGKYNEAETQTHLFLMSSKYDEVFEIQQILDEIIEEFKMRQEFDGIFETLNITDEEGLSANVMQERIYDQVYAGGKKNSIDAMLLDMQKLDPNHKPEDKPSIFKLSRFGQQSRKDSQRLLKLRKEGGMLPDHVMVQDGELAESEVHDVNDGQFSEAIGMLRDTLRDSHSDKGSSMSPQSLQSREVRGSINTQHEGFGRRESQINGPSLGNLSDSVISKDQDDVGHTHATGTDDFTMGTLVDDHTVAQSGQEQGDKMQVIQEAPEEEMGSPSVYRRNKSNSANQSVITQTNEDGSKADFVLKKNTSKGTADLHAKLDRHNISDQAKLLLMTRLYRVMLDKNKSLNAGTTEMHEQILNEKENSKKLEENISELKDQLKAYKIGRCPNCATSGGSKEHGNKTDRSNRSLGEDATPTIELDDDIDLDDDEDDNDSANGGTTTKVDKKGKQRKNYHNRTTVAPNPDANKKKQKETKDFAANAIIEKVKNKKVSKFKNFLPVKSICKQINSFYMERMNNAKENPSVKEESLVSFVYNWYTHAFGFKKIAEQKFIIFVLSVKKYLHFVRVNLFARFMNLLDGQSNFTLDEFNKYLEGLEILSNSHLGISINNSETDSKHYTPFLRGLEYVKFFSENKMPVEEYIEFKKEFDSLKENDPKNLNRNGIIDIDRLFSKVLVKYRAICNRTKQFVVNAFKAADLDGNKYCSLKEFITIYKNIESEKYDYDFVESLFSEHADVRIEGSINLSFDKFTVVCVEFGLFSDQQQDLFIGVNGHSELVQSMEKLQMNWPMLYLELKEQMETVGKYSEEEEKYWTEILDILQDRISNFQNMDSTDFKPIMIAYKILSRELTDLIDKYAETDGYGVKKIKKTANDL